MKSIQELTDFNVVYTSGLYDLKKTSFVTVKLYLPSYAEDSTETVSIATL